MFAQLGDIKFEGFKGFDTLNFDGDEASYAAHDLIGGKPRLQKTGVTLRDISASIRFHANFCNPSQELAALNMAKVEGDILPLVFGTGEYIGDFVITTCNHTIDETFDDGLPIQISCSLQIKEYVPYSKIELEQQTARKNAFAVGNKKSAVLQPPAPPIPAQAASDTFVSATAQTNQIDKLVNQYENNGSSLERLRVKIIDASNKAQSKFNDFQDLLEEGEGLAGLYDDVVGLAGNVRNKLQAIIDCFPVEDISSLLNANNSLQSSVGTLRNSASGILNTIILRK